MRIPRTRSLKGLLCALSVVISLSVWSADGDWLEPRQNPHLTSIQPLPGGMTEPPEILARIEVAASRPSLIAVASPDGSETWGLGIVSGALYCFDTAGERKWLSHPPGLNFTSIVTVEDIDGDGRVEILLKAGRTADPYSASVLVSLEDGHRIWSYDVDPMSYAWYLFADRYFPEKNTKQVVVLMQGYPPDADNGYIALFDFVDPGQAPQELWRYDFHDYTAFPKLLRSDLDGDGTDEICVQTHSRMWILDARTGDVKQFIGWDVSPANNRSYGLVRFVDLNGDGLEEFLCIADFSHHHEVLLNVGGRLEPAWVHGWPDETVNRKLVSTWPESPQADIDGDGRIEVIVSMYNSENENAWLVRIYDALTGELRHSIPGAVAMVVDDIDGDGIAEVGVSLSVDPTKTEWQGSQLLKLVDGEFQLLWEDDDALFLRPAPETPADEERVRFTRGGATFALLHEPGTGIVSAPSLDTPSVGTDFSAVPAIRGSARHALLAADLDGDRQKEVLIYTGTTLKVVSVDDFGNTALQRIYPSDALPAIADLDGDGNLEVITGSVSMTGTPVIEARTPALDDRLLWRSVYPEPTRSGLPWTMRKLYIRPGNFTGKATPDLYVWAGIPMVRSTVLDGLTGGIVWEKGEFSSIGRYYGPTHQPASVYDYNGDGADDIIATIPDYYCVINGTSGRFLKAPAFPPTIFRQASQGLYTLPAVLEERETVPTVCLVGGHYFQGAMSIKTRPYWYKLPVVGENRFAAESFLRTEDGTWLLGVGRQNGKFGCIDVATGALRWEVDLFASCAEACALDVDGDGRLEFVLATSHSQLIALGDDNGQPREVWRRDLPSGAGVSTYPAAIASVIAADVNADGMSEIIVPLHDGYVYILGVPHSDVEDASFLH